MTPPPVARHLAPQHLHLVELEGVRHLVQDVEVRDHVRVLRHRDHWLDLEFGRIVASEIEVPNMLANLV